MAGAEKAEGPPGNAFLPVAGLVPYARNARTHSDDQVASIMGSLIEFGWTRPILIDGKGIVAGHGTAMAARRLYEQGKAIRLPSGELVPAGMALCLDVSGWTDTQRKAYIIADNQLALAAGWDKQMLALDLGDLKAEGFDLNLIGFDPSDLAVFLSAGPGKSDPDAIPEVTPVPISRTKDVWLLGKHRLMCGDSTSAEDVARLLDGDKPVLMVTDPPYGVDYDPTWRDDRPASPGALFAKPSINRGKVANDDRAEWSEAWALFSGDVAYVWHGERQSADMHAQLLKGGLVPRNLIVWAKPSLTFGRGHYHSQHETCWYAVRKGQTAHWHGGTAQTTLWEIAGMNPMGQARGAEDGKTGHGTQKPVECMRRPIENNSKPGDLVYEPFSGSGTTIIACQIMDRAARAMEIEPAYVDVAVKRWEAFTGESAILAGDDRTFAEVTSARQGEA